MNRLAMMILKNIHLFPGAYAKLCSHAKHTDTVPEAEKYGHIRWMLQRAVGAGNIHIEATGMENIPREEGFIACANHQGLFDVVALVVTCEEPMAAVFKKELSDVPLVKQIIACTKSFSMDREDVRQSLGVIQNVVSEVKAGRNYLIFPEGTRSKKGNEMLDFHGGSFKAALKARCPVLPIAFIDSFKVLDQKGTAPVSMQIHYLPPIPYEEYKDLKAVELAALVKERIQSVIDQHTKE